MMMSKAKYWMGIGKPKNQHSLENLKYLFGILNKNQTVTENNKDLLIETLRSISEILIWGDQNDSSVFDFFLEKQMITFFLHYMKQKHGRYICVQLLQTLNILFENIRNETSLYFLLSNNHINNIIFHRFDFSDEEVMAYFISFLKTLSLKLNRHSIHFFFNERQSEFPLLVEALKFFDHPESMVRIAVRTLTLNVYNVQVQSMQNFLKERTAAPYFSNLVWLIRNQLLDLDLTVKNTVDHTKKDRLMDLIDEHVDHLNYLQDIYLLDNLALSNCLTEQLIRRLLVPVYLSSLLLASPTNPAASSASHHLSVKFKKSNCVQANMALFSLAHLFAVISDRPLLSDLCELIFFINDEKVIEDMCTPVRLTVNRRDQECYLSEPKSLVTCLASLKSSPNKLQKTGQKSLKDSRNAMRSQSTPELSKMGEDSDSDKATASKTMLEEPDIQEIESDKAKTKDVVKFSFSVQDEELKVELGATHAENKAANTVAQNLQLLGLSETEQQSSEKRELKASASGTLTSCSGSSSQNLSQSAHNITDDEKYRQRGATVAGVRPKAGVIFQTLLDQLNSAEYSEANSLLALTLFYALLTNPGVPDKFSETLRANAVACEWSLNYSGVFMNRLIGIVAKAVEPEFRVRLVTLELAVQLIKRVSLLVVPGSAASAVRSLVTDFQLACIDQAREQSAFVLRRHFKNEEMFLDMFEHEYQCMNLGGQPSVAQIENLLRDWSILLPPTSTPLSGVDFVRRFPCGDTERLKQSIRTFFLLRDLYLRLTGEPETQLPLTKQEYLVRESDALDLNTSDLIACTVKLSSEKRERRFLVIDPIQFILVEPEVKRIGWGVVKFSDLVQDVEVTPDKEDSRSLLISIKKCAGSSSSQPASQQVVRLNSVFTFDDHIRCMAAKQHLVRARDRARRMKLEKIAQLLDIVSASANNNSHTTKNFNSKNSSMANSAAASDVLSYSLVAGYNNMIQASLNHPGRASHISHSWSSFALPTADRAPTSPMAALNYSRTQSITSYPQTPTSPSTTSTTSTTINNTSITNFSTQARQPTTRVTHSPSAFTFPSYATTCPPDPNPVTPVRERESSSAAAVSPILHLSANDSNALINANDMSQVDTAVASQVHILPPSSSSAPPSPDKPLSSSGGSNSCRTKSQGAIEFTI